MRQTISFALVVFASLGCGSAITPNQPDGQDCNFAQAATACRPTSFCDPGQAAGDQGYARRRVYGLLRDKMHVVGTCRPKGAAGAACDGASTCLSGRCVHALAGGAGRCE